MRILERRGSSEREDLPPGRGARPDRPGDGRSPLLVDAAVTVVLVVVAYLMRRHGLPHNGLFFDDAMTAAGSREPVWRLLSFVPIGDGGFVLLLKALGTVTRFNSSSLAAPALVVGVAGPAALYLVMTRIGYARSIGALLAAVLAVNSTHAEYSGRVKSYVIDPLIVLGIAVVLPRLAKLRWSWWTAAAGVLVGVVIGSFSPFVLVAVLAGLVVVVVRSGSGDRVQRIAALVITGAIAVVVSSLAAPTGSTTLHQGWDKGFDAFVRRSANPVRFAHEIWRHLVRVAAVFPGGGHGLASLWTVLALAGLGTLAWKRRHGATGMRAQYLLVVLGLALGGGILDKFPFGPTQHRIVGAGTAVLETGVGGRVSLWLVPVFAIGLAIVLQFLRDTAGRRPGAGLLFDAAIVIAAVLVLLGGYRPAQPYPFAGERSAARFVESHLLPGDRVLVLHTDAYAYAYESKLPSSLHRVTGLLAFSPRFADSRIGIVGDTPDWPARAGASLASASRVYFVATWYSDNALTRFDGQVRRLLTAHGFERGGERHFGSVNVEAWLRAGRSRPAAG